MCIPLIFTAYGFYLFIARVHTVATVHRWRLLSLGPGSRSWLGTCWEHIFIVESVHVEIRTLDGRFFSIFFHFLPETHTHTILCKKENPENKLEKQKQQQ